MPPGDTMMIDSNWMIWIGLALFALLVLRRLGTIAKTMRVALLPSRGSDQAGHIAHDLSEIRVRLESIHRSLESLNGTILLINEHLKGMNLTVEQIHNSVLSDVKGIHYTLDRMDSSLDTIEERLNPENRVYSWKPGW
jgi:hypothetical protein